MCEVWVCTWSVGRVPRQRGSAPRPAPATVPAVVQRVGRGRGRGHRVAAPGVVTGRVALPRVLKYFLQSHVIFSPLCSHSTCTSSKPPLTGAAVSEASRAESAWYLSRYVDSRCRYIQGVSKKMSFSGKTAITTFKLIKNANVGGVLESSGNLLHYGH